MIPEKIVQEVHDHIEDVIARNEPVGVALWNQFIQVHPADIGSFLSTIDQEQVKLLFNAFPADVQLAVFQHISDPLKVFCLSFLQDVQRQHILNNTPLDELTDVFDRLSDDDLKKYLRLLHKNDRDTIVSLMQFNPESAGGIMDTDVLTLMEDFTVEKSIRVLQRLQPDQDLHRSIFVTSQDNQLIGYINLEDLVLTPPTTRIASFMRKNILVIPATQDQEAVASTMVHYGLMIAPVTDEHNRFLGVISSDTLVDVIEQEASEDVYKMAAMTPIKETYFQTSFTRMLLERSSILTVLLVAQTFSSLIIEQYQATISGILIILLPMLISVGGNASSQTSAIVIQGLASGEINTANIGRFIRREILMASALALILGLVSFARIILVHGSEKLLSGLAVSISLATIVLVSIVLGSFIPFILKKMKIDPAFSAGPGLATLMDILGLLIYCYITKLMLSW